MAVHSAGSDIDAFCNRCQLTLAHVIIALAQGRPARVECKTCRTVHAYKGASRPKPAKSSAKKDTSREPASAADYDRLMTGKDVARAKRYKPAEILGAGEILDHKNFGLGIVTRQLSGGKVEVLFREGPRVLVHSIA